MSEAFINGNSDAVLICKNGLLMPILGLSVIINVVSCLHGRYGVRFLFTLYDGLNGDIVLFLGLKMSKTPKYAFPKTLEVTST